MSKVENTALVKVLATADWSGVSIGNKALIQAAIAALNTQAELLATARNSVSYQAGMQNLNNEAGQQHAARLNDLLARIDATVSVQNILIEPVTLNHESVRPEPSIIAAGELRSMTSEAKYMGAEKFLDLINARLSHAASQGASCIVIKAEDGFVLYHKDNTKKPLERHVISLLRDLDGAGYTFVKDNSPTQEPCLRVYFGAAPSANRVMFRDLETWAQAAGN